MPFSLLPWEIRHMIYLLCFPSREINLCTNTISTDSAVEVFRNPTVLALNHESRVFTLQHYDFLPQVPEFSTTKSIAASDSPSQDAQHDSASESPTKGAQQDPQRGIYVHLELDTLWASMNQLLLLLYGTSDQWLTLEYASSGMRRKVHSVYWKFRKLEIRKGDGKDRELVGKYTDVGWDNGDAVNVGLTWFEGEKWAVDGVFGGEGAEDI